MTLVFYDANLKAVFLKSWLAGNLYQNQLEHYKIFRFLIPIPNLLSQKLLITALAASFPAREEATLVSYNHWSCSSITVLRQVGNSIIIKA